MPAEGSRRFPVRIRTEVPGPRSKALRAREEALIAPGYQAIASHAGIAFDSGEGAELIDVDGNRFLDLAAGICVAGLGYAHPDYVRALSAQLARTHIGSFTSPARVQALEALARVLPKPLSRVQLYSGGAEAVESAIRLARAHTGKFAVLSFWGGFHGKTAGVLAQMGSNFKHDLGPLAPGATLTPYADCAFCPFKAKYPSCGLLCVDFAKEKLERETTGRLAAVLVEPMQGTAGNVIPPPDFLPAVAQLAKEHGALLIADEMITGFGRTGTMFAAPAVGVTPDIMTCGKALGGGFPVSAVVTRDDIAQAKPWSKPSFSSSSYGANPLASAAIAAAVDIIERERLPTRAAEVGAVLKRGLEGVASRHPAVRNVRGSGLFIGFDLMDGDALWPATRTRTLFSALIRRGVVTMAYAPRVRVNPPLVLGEAQAEEGVALLEEALVEVGA
jgi:4-aminobutyrate aminotransferase/(S)-3-amino-2-methylpropionate transaminase